MALITPFSVGVAALGGLAAYYIVGGTRMQHKAKKEHRGKRENEYAERKLPIRPLSDLCVDKSLGAKECKLLYTERGPHGTVKYYYELPTTKQRFYSYAPVDMHTAH